MSSLLNYVGKFFGSQKISSDSLACKVYYRGNVLVLLTVAFLTFTFNLFGQPIGCVTTLESYSHGMALYCMSHGSYVSPNHTNLDKTPNVSTASQDFIDKLDDYIVTTWIFLFMILYAVYALLSYSGRVLWRHWQGRILQDLITNFNEKSLSREAKKEAVTEACERFSGGIRHYSTFGKKYVHVVLWNIATVLAQLAVTFLYIANWNFEFPIQALAYFDSNYEEYPDELTTSFPQTVKCDLHNFGPSGTIENHDALCYLHYTKSHMIFLSLYTFCLGINLVLFSTEILWYIFVYLFSGLRSRRVRHLLSVSDTHISAEAISNLKFGSYLVVTMLTENIDVDIIIDMLCDI